jgi:hypothetical protein
MGVVAIFHPIPAIKTPARAAHNVRARLARPAHKCGTVRRVTAPRRPSIMKKLALLSDIHSNL